MLVFIFIYIYIYIFFFFVLIFAPSGMNPGSVPVGKGEGYSVGDSEGGRGVSACRVKQGIRE